MNHEAETAAEPHGIGVPGDRQEAPGGAAIEHDRKARERLLRAAADVFDRKGYAGASVREIVAQAGITKPVLYYHYGSKEGILLAILEEGARTFNEALSRAATAPGTARDRLVAMAGEILTLFRQHMPIVRVAHAVYFGPRGATPPFDFGKYESALAGTIRRVVEDGVAAGELRAARTEDVVMLFNGLIATFADTGFETAPRLGPDSIPRVIDLIFEGLAPRPEGKEY